MDNSQQAASIFNKYAQQYQEKFMDTSMYHESFDWFCNLIKKNHPDVLELACGPGNITKYLLNRRPDLNLLGLDLAPNMIELAKINNPKAQFAVMDCRDIDQLNMNLDGIMCGFCLPYLSFDETNRMIQAAGNLLKTGGVIYISTMEDDYASSGIRKGSQGDEIYMHFYLETDIVSILEQNNFQIRHKQRIETTATDGSRVIDLILIAIKF